MFSVQSLVQFGSKGKNERAITGKKISLTCPLLILLSSKFNRVDR